MKNNNRCSRFSRKWLIVILLLVAVGLAAVAGCYLAQLQASQRQSPSASKPESPPISSGYDPGADPERAFIYAGLPKPTDPKVTFTILKNRGYLVGYSEKRKDPLFAAYRLFKVENPPKLPRPTRFTVDDRTEAKVKSEDYTGTGYDRGHMAPNHASPRGTASRPRLRRSSCPISAPRGQT